MCESVELLTEFMDIRCVGVYGEQISGHNRIGCLKGGLARGYTGAFHGYIL